MTKSLQAVIERLPVLGIFAFSLCSTWSIYHLLAERARHPAALLWIPAVLIEIVAAWSVAQVVSLARQVTRSNISKQDRRFYALILAAFCAVALPLLSVSCWANTVEYGNAVLGALFPIASIGCAVGAALPGAVQAYRKQQESERQEALAERQRKRKEQEMKRKEEESRRKAEESRRKVLATLGSEAATLRFYAGSPAATQEEAARALAVSERTIRNHLARLESAGLIRRNGNGVEVLVEV